MFLFTQAASLFLKLFILPEDEIVLEFWMLSEIFIW